MQDKKSLSTQLDENSVGQGFGSYEFMIANHVLNQIGLTLEIQEIKQALDDKKSKYYLLLLAPMSKVFNALLLAQIQSYKLFCQKKLADFIVLTNPSLEQQQQIDFEDEISADLLEYRKKMVEEQEELRIIEQKFYDGLATCLASLKREVRQQILQFGDYIGNLDPSFIEEIYTMRSNVQDEKQLLLEARKVWQDFAEEINLKWIEKGGFNLSTSDEIERRGELMFWKNLGLEE